MNVRSNSSKRKRKRATLFQFELIKSLNYICAIMPKKKLIESIHHLVYP